MVGLWGVFIEMVPTLCATCIIPVVDALMVAYFEHVTEPVLTIVVLDSLSIDVAHSGIGGQYFVSGYQQLLGRFV